MTSDKTLTRIPAKTIRSRAGRKTLTHGLRQGWRTEYPEQFPVTTTKTKLGRAA